MAPFAEIERRPRRHGDHRSVDCALAIKGSLEPCVMLHLYPRSQLHVSLLVLHDDGGALCCATNAAALALADAGVAMSSLPAACGALQVGRNILVDPCDEEGMSGGASAEFCFEARTGAVVRAGMAARCGVEALRSMREASLQGARAVHSAMRAAVKERADRLLALADAGEVGPEGEGRGGAVGPAVEVGGDVRGVIPPVLPRGGGDMAGGALGAGGGSALEAAAEVRRRAHDAAAELTAWQSAGWQGSGVASVEGGSKRREGGGEEEARLREGFRRGGGAAQSGAGAGDYAGLARRAVDGVSEVDSRGEAAVGQVSRVRRRGEGGVAFELKKQAAPGVGMQLQSSGPAGAQEQAEGYSDEDEDEESGARAGAGGVKALRKGKRSGKGRGGRRVVATGFEN